MRKILLAELFAALAALATASASAQTVLLYASSEFDAGSTYYTLHHCGGCVEGDLIMRPFAANPSVFPVLGASAWAVARLATILRNDGHSRWASVVEWGVVGLHGYAGFHNLECAP